MECPTTTGTARSAMSIIQVIDLIGFIFRTIGLLGSACIITYIVHYHTLGRQTTRMKGVLNILSMVIVVVSLNDITGFIVDRPSNSTLIAAVSLISGSISVGIVLSLVQCLPIIKRLMGANER